METLINIVRAFSLYRQKTVFFAALTLLLLGGYLLSGGSKITADQPIKTVSLINNIVDEKMEIKESGGLFHQNNKIGQVVPADGKDELRQVIFDKPLSYISSVKITLDLPKAVAESSQVQLLAVHGVGSASAKMIDNNTVVFEAVDVGPQSELTMVLKMPSGTINYSFLTGLRNQLSSFNFSYWLIIAIALPLLTYLILLYIILKEIRGGVEKPIRAVSSPPMSLPPAIVGVITKQKIGPRAIAATLVDLAIRGDIVIVDRERGFSFGKNRLEESLIGYEKILLGKIFKNAISSDRQMIDERVSKYLYSKKVSAFYYLIQMLAVRLGYLRHDYRKTKNRYSLFGVIFFFVGVGGFLLKVFSISTAPPYSLFFWLGMIIAAVIIFVLADYIPSRTEAGRAEAANWLAFKGYLSDSTPVEYSEDNYDLFVRYLPYAIVLECEAAWAQRFAKHNFVVPEWFVSDKGAVGLEDFCLLLFPIVSYVGQNLDSIKQPGV